VDDGPPEDQKSCDVRPSLNLPDRQTSIRLNFKPSQELLSLSNPVIGRRLRVRLHGMTVIGEEMCL
jgi:hypothetical protein